MRGASGVGLRDGKYMLDNKKWFSKLPEKCKELFIDYCNDNNMEFDEA